MTHFTSNKRLLLRTAEGLFNLIGGSTTLYLMVIRPWHLKWGATADEVQLFLEPGAFIMERKMLLGIKQRAEKQPPR